MPDPWTKEELVDSELTIDDISQTWDQAYFTWEDPDWKKVQKTED